MKKTAPGAKVTKDAKVSLSSYYSRFRVSARVLLTGHSHQAWPDVAFEAQQRAWLDAAELVDDKWEKAAEVAEDVRVGWRQLLNEPRAEIALGQNTHELVVRLLSAVLPMSGARGSSGAGGAGREELITTDGEFHTIRRQLDRLAEAGVDVVKIAARPADTLAERIAHEVNDDTACVLVSSVLFETAEIVPDLAAIAQACDRHGTTLLVDAYHQLNVVPFDVAALGLANAFIVGGGYKYCQLGEGNCFMRVPPACELRPVLTGWFAEFERLTRKPDAGVAYGEGAARFAGATYDPTAHYRAAAVFQFHADRGLTVERLREISRHQVQLLRTRVEALDLPHDVAHVEAMPEERRAGFLAIRTPHAAAVVAALRARRVFADARGDVLRLGPAPYLTDSQIEAGVAAVAAALAGAAQNPSF